MADRNSYVGTKFKWIHLRLMKYSTQKVPQLLKTVEILHLILSEVWKIPSKSWCGNENTMYSEIDQRNMPFNYLTICSVPPSQ